MTLDRLLARLPDPARPFLTFYDDATGERVELSGVTTANWVAKTSNFLVDDLDAGPGTRIRLGLPSHWLRFVWLLSCWSVGAAVVDVDADIGVSGPELMADEPHRLAASLRPLGSRFAEPPTGFLDLGAEVPPHGDVFVALDPPSPETPALDLEGRRATQGELSAATQPSGERLLIEPGPLARDIDLVVAAGLGGGSLVLVAGASTDVIARLAEQERARIT
ncbi:TIGR03089 family protein [Aeromicrobium sp.]|uniref:TIGR03089 family protein n=1 Tax=Aeromicrobium sp. TaxID=1871063 RepID=UPI003D6BE946